MKKRSIIALFAAAMLGLSGCSDPAGSTAGSSQSAADKKPGTEMPTVKEAGKETRLEFPKSNPPKGLQKTVIAEGEGRVIEENDFVVANYVGQVWGNKNHSIRHSHVVKERVFHSSKLSQAGLKVLQA